MPKAPRSKKFHHQKKRGLNYAKSLVLDKKIKFLEREITEYEAKIAQCEIVFYAGVSHTFQPFWTRAPAARKRPILIAKANEPVKARHA